MSGVGATGPVAVMATPGADGSSRLPSTASLESEIGRCQRQLEDLVTCPSAKTPEGKAAIQSASDRITSARAEIDRIQQARAAARSSGVSGSSAGEARQATNGVSGALPTPGAAVVYLRSGDLSSGGHSVEAWA